MAIGGWECRGGCPPGKARWFAVELTKANYPWMFHRGEPFRVIASLELLATLICILAFDVRGYTEDGTSSVTLGAGPRTTRAMPTWLGGL